MLLLLRSQIQWAGTAHVPDSWAPSPQAQPPPPWPPPCLRPLRPRSYDDGIGDIGKLCRKDVLFAGADAYVIHRDMRMELASTRRKPRPGPSSVVPAKDTCTLAFEGEKKPATHALLSRPRSTRLLGLTPSAPLSHCGGCVTYLGRPPPPPRWTVRRPPNRRGH